MLTTLLYHVQRFGLSSAFFYMAWVRGRPLFEAEPWQRAGAVISALGVFSPEGVVVLQRLCQGALLLAFNVLVGTFLLITRKPTEPAKRLVHVVVPLLATFAYLAYGWAHLLPDTLHQRRLLPNLGLPGVVLAGALVLAAYLFSFAALVTLRRSFAVFVEVRVGVMRGPYRLVRHPMYLGYVLVVLALFVSRPTMAYALISAVVLAITVFRARLEEQMLAEHVPGYREYMARTGMLFPRLRRRPPPSERLG